ncbi:MAG: hypothetical protein EPO24_08020 [Bacteroidetes bacterium]|nr:MAG: hypothetical protein EPO24_08020 [Bacteroidota bacterium]
MSPGRSGCYVVKIISKSKNESGATMLPKWWVVKISKGNCQILEDEISNYNELIKTPLPREAFPKLLHSKPIVYSDLSAIVLEFENEAQTFKDYLNSEEITKAQTNIVTKQLAEYLTKLYGDPIKKLSQVWKDYYSFKGKVIVYIESFFKLNKNVLASILDNQMLNRVSQFISSSGKSEEKIFNYRKDIDTRVVHGDLNSRNVLVRSDGKPVFIDFALRKQSPVTIDIAKLERDLIFRVCDADTKSEFDWNSIVKWREFDKLYNTSEVLNLKESDINSLQSYEKIISTILVLRNHLIGMSSGTDDKEYMLALLHYSILVLGNSEISLQKKVYCIEYIYNIICKFDQS